MRHQIRMRQLFNENEITIEEYLSNIYPQSGSLYITNNSLTYIPSLTRFTHLTSIDIRFTHLTKLPKLPDTLERLYVPSNKLESLPSFPKSLEELLIDDNKIRFLPELPNDDIIIVNSGIYNNKMMYKELVNYNGSRPLKKVINMIHRFREIYFICKFGKKLFYGILKRRQLKKPWFDEYFRKIFHPARFMYLLETYNYDMNEDEYYKI